MARYIDADKPIEQVKSLEQLARKRVSDTPTSSPAYTRYYTQWQEREKMLAVLKAQPAADVVPRSEVVKNALLEFKKQVHDKAVYPHSQDMYAYISLRVFDAILQEYVSRLEGKK